MRAWSLARWVGLKNRVVRGAMNTFGNAISRLHHLHLVYASWWTQYHSIISHDSAS